MNEAMVKSVLAHFEVYDSERTIRQGNWLVTTCPFAEYYHNHGTDRNPSFGIAIVEDNYSYFKCFSCKQKGLFYLLPDMLARAEGELKGDAEGVSFVLQAEEDAFSQMGLVIPQVMDYSAVQKPEPLNRLAYNNLFESVVLHDNALEYLRGRGITEHTAQRLGILFDEDELRVVFPVEGVDKELYGFSGRTIRADWERFNKPPLRRYPRIKNYSGLKKEWFLLGEHNIQPGKPIFVVEGLFGYAHLMQQGIDELGTVVAAMGSDLSKAQAGTLINSCCPVYLLFDNDDAGTIGLFGSSNGKGAISLLYNYCPLFVPEWPEGKIDPDELIKDDIVEMVETTYTYSMH